MITLRDYQEKAVNEIVSILTKYNLVYLAGEVRVGKSLMSLESAKRMNWRKVCFITKKMAISSVKKDYQAFGHKFQLFDIFNFEQAPNIHPVYDAYIIDEASSISAFPKPGKYCRCIHKLIHKNKSPVLLMSGTPTPESPSQIFHQFWVSPFTPFQGYGHRSGEFYGWAKEYVDVKQKRVNGFMINDYKKANEPKIKEVTKHYMVTVSQQDAGFVSHVEEEIFYVDIDKRLYQLMRVLKDNKVYQMKKTGDYIVADTPVRMQQAFHQLSSGTIITGEEGSKKYHVLDESKAWFIKTKFAGQKIAIYYNFISEGEILRRVFPNHTSDPDVFNENNELVFICQMISGRMGVNLSTCDWLLMYNIGFSATTYWQVRARMQTQTRTKASKLGWIFSRQGLEKHVLKIVSKKKDFTSKYFERVLISEF